MSGRGKGRGEKGKGSGSDKGKGPGGDKGKGQEKPSPIAKKIEPVKEKVEEWPSLQAPSQPVVEKKSAWQTAGPRTSVSTLLVEKTTQETVTKTPTGTQTRRQSTSSIQSSASKGLAEQFQSILIVEEESSEFVRAPLEEKREKTPTPAAQKAPSPESQMILFPPKPKQLGTLGRPIRLRTNHYRVALNKPVHIYQYDIQLEKKVHIRETDKDEIKLLKNKELMKDVFQYLLNKILGQSYANKVIFNLSKNLYSLKKFPFEESMTYEIQLNKAKYSLKLQAINEMDIDQTNYTEPVHIMVLDLIFTHSFSQRLVQLNRSFFKEGFDYQQIGLGLELWRGAYSTVKPYEVGLTWNVNSAHAAFYTSEDLLQLACKHYNCPPEQLRDQITRDRDRDQIGVSFINEYRGRDIKTTTGGYRKKIQAFGPDALYKFEWNKDNKTVLISVKDYLKRHYNIDLKYPSLPCIDIGKKSYLPLELCKTQLKNKANLTDRETADLVKLTAVKAPERMQYINNWALNSGISKDPVLKEYNISVDLKLVELDGRVIEPPDVEYAPRMIAKSAEINEKGAWNHQNYKFKNSKSIKRWICLNFSSRTSDKSAYDFATKIVQIGQKHGMQIANPLGYDEIKKRVIRDDEIKQLFVKMYDKYKPLDLVLVIFSGTSSAYKVIKTCGDLLYGVATQGVEEKNVYKMNDQTVSNILLKINNKLGGVNFALSRMNKIFTMHLQDLYNGPLMIFGADVTHPSPGDKQRDSIVGVVGSLDSDCCNYAARLFVQRSPTGQAYEMIHDLDKMFKSLLQSFFDLHKQFPKKIVFYRDGVSEGQFQLVLRHEINRIRAACQSISSGYKPAITFVVVQKRHHTRFFPVNQQDKKGKSENIPPGTVVDRDLVSKYMFDFFLCSHSGIQGTSRPCRYFVLHDDNNFTMNQIQVLSFYLCHVYSRCPRSVSYPAPAYYAHLAAFRGRDYIRKDLVLRSKQEVVSEEIALHPNIQNKMFYC